MEISAKVIRDSISTNGIRLTSVEAAFPKFILAELNTHRMFSRNSASSRAIPVKKIMDQVENDPYTPIFYGSNKPGMQAGDELQGDKLITAKSRILALRNSAVDAAAMLSEIDGLHKQHANRYIE